VLDKSSIGVVVAVESSESSSPEETIEDVVGDIGAVVDASGGTVVVALLTCVQGIGHRSRCALCKKAWKSSNDDSCDKPGYHSG